MLFTAWLIYYTVFIYLKGNYNLFYLLSGLSLLFGYISQIAGFSYNPYILYFAGLFFSHIQIRKNTISVLVTVFYLSVLILSLTHISFPLKDSFLTSLSILPIFYIVFRQTIPINQIYAYIYLLSLMIVSFIDERIFEFLNILIPLYLTVYVVKQKIEKQEEELENFKIRVKKEIETEVQKEIEKLDIKLQIAYKKLKEIFKLNTYTIKEITTEEIAERVVKGLADLGYTGSVFEIKKYSILKKEGFFPNLKTYIEEIFSSINSVKELEDKKLLIIPLFVEEERLGTLAVYSKNEISNEEVEFLITYASSIATSIAKIEYFTQIIKLRDLIYTAVDSIKIPLVITDSNLRIEIANEAFLNLINSNSINKETIFEKLPIIEKISDTINYVFENKVPAEKIVDILDGRKEKFYEIRIYPVISENRIESLVFIIEDITEKREMEKQILHSEKLAVIGRLTAGISHEIKNPLAIISQSAFSLKRKISKSCDNQHVSNMIELVERIEKSTERAKDIIDRLLNFSKPYYSKVEIINIKEVLQEAIKLSILQTQKSDIKINTYLKDAYIKGDKNSLIQLFINIIINSIEAIASTGKIVVKVTNDKKNKLVKISIKDTGPGIPQEILDKIFEPFFTTKEKGTGLGLSVSYKIVKDHDGKILVNSKEGEGAEFNIIFPMAEE